MDVMLIVRSHSARPRSSLATLRPETRLWWPCALQFWGTFSNSEVERPEREIGGMTLTPPPAGKEAARSAFAGPLDKKSCRASDACSMERRRVVRQKETVAIQTPTVKTPTGCSSSGPTAAPGMFRENAHHVRARLSAAAPEKVRLLGAFRRERRTLR